MANPTASETVLRAEVEAEAHCILDATLPLNVARRILDSREPTTGEAAR